MLRSVHIRDFVLVDKAEIHFNAGFTVFSGETGAGKSILIDALSLALGARSDTGFIREGATRADITAVFDTPPGLADWLEQHDFDHEDDLIMRRTIDRQGRSRAFINGVPVTLGQLRDLGEQLVDIHGQHAHQSLLKPAHQRLLLDSHGGHLELAQRVRTAWQQWQAALAALQQATDHAAARDQERQALEWQLSELERLGLQDGEWETLNNDHGRLAHAQSLIEGATRALGVLDGDEVSARKLLNQALSPLQRLQQHDARLQDIIASLDSALIATDEAISDLNSYLSSLDLDPDALAQAEQRMSAIFDTARKLRVEPEDLLALQTQLHEQLETLHSASDIQELTRQADEARLRYDDVAQQLSKARNRTAARLAAQVTKAMQTLAMEGGRFDIALHPSDASGHGNATVEFLVAGHTGATPRPLARVASGGELARLSLALSVIASQAARVPTLIFDEVDTGIGGGVAEVVGRLLRELGDRHQVLCVTHLPQVAACGSHHFEVSRQTQDTTTLSRIVPLDKNGRIHEIARMLGGLTITDTTRRHAKEMLQLG